MAFLPATTRLKRRRPPRWIYPRQLERKYVSEVGVLFGSTLMSAIRTLVLPLLPRLVSMHERTRPERADSIRTDGWPDEVRMMREKLTFAMTSMERYAERSASSISVDLYKQNRNQWHRIQTAMMGAAAVGENESWAGDTLTSWIDTNVNLMTKLSAESIANVEGVVTRGLQTGLRVEEIATGLVGDLGVGKKAETKARFVARDQIAKLNGQITQARQTELGVRRYIWRTSDDERVRGRPGGKWENARPSHWSLEGMVCVWSDATIVIRYDEAGGADRIKRSSLNPPGYEGHPGSDYQCRCYAEPMLDDVMQISTEEQAAPAPAKLTPKVRRQAAMTRKPLRSMTQEQQDAFIDRKMSADAPRLERWQADLKAAKEQYERLSFQERSTRYRSRIIPREPSFGPDRERVLAQLKEVSAAARQARREYERLSDQKIQSYLAKRWGARKPSTVQLGDYTHPTTAAHKKRSKMVQKYVGDVSKMFESDALAENGGRIVANVDRLPASNHGRAFEENGTMYLPTETSRRQVAHELGHAIEFHNANIRKASEDFLTHRTLGEAKVPLSMATGRSGYGWREVCKKDRFPDAYCGKIYPESIQNGKGATEILSMGLQYFMTDPLQFFRTDPEYFHFIVKVLAGVF